MSTGIDPLSRLPRGLSRRVRSAQRDLSMLGNRLIFGKSPAPIIPRRERPDGDVLHLTRPAPSLSRTVAVVDVVRETPDAVSLYLTELDGSPIAFESGQFLSVDVEVDGKTHRRAYSLASPCLPKAPTHITVKRITDGVVSHHIVDNSRTGDTLSVLGPSGNFTLDAAHANSQHLLMVAGGSGITPIMSLIETFLRTGPDGRVTLIYGNRNREDIIFAERLEALAREFRERLIVDHVLQAPPEDWEGGTGLLSEEVLCERMTRLGVTRDRCDRFYLCGPTPMMDSAHAVLDGLGVDRARIAEERFTRPEERHGTQGSDKVEVVLVSIGEDEHAVEVAPGQTILEAGLASGLSMPFSCVMGGCAACRVRLHDGQVTMEEPNCLSPTERDQGYVLACVGRPLTGCKLAVEAS